MDHTRLAVAVFDRNARTYQEQYMDVQHYAPALDLLCTRLTPHARVLELGCGPGNITRYLLDRRPDLDILGTDLAPCMLELARANNPEARFQSLDCRNIRSLRQKYDAIVAGFCLPYLSRAEAIDLIAAAAQVLSSGGLLYLSTMEGDYSRSGMQYASNGDGLFMYYHEVGYLQQALTDHGFTVADLQRVRYALRGAPVTDLVLLAQKHTGAPAGSSV